MSGRHVCKARLVHLNITSKCALENLINNSNNYGSNTNTNNKWVYLFFIL